MALPGVIAGAIGRFEASGYELSDWIGEFSDRVLDVDGTQTELEAGAVPTTSGRAASTVKDNRRTVRVDGTNITLGSEEVEVDFGTEWAARGRVVMAERSYEDGSGHFPFTLLSAVSKVKCERLVFDTEAVRKAWKDDGALSDTWLAGHKDVAGDSTTMAYGEASADEPADIGLGFERSWQGFMLQGVVYATGYVACYEDEIEVNGFLRFVEETLLPHGFVPEDETAFLQETLGEDEDE